jgi:hypothetical protein
MNAGNRDGAVLNGESDPFGRTTPAVSGGENPRQEVSKEHGDQTLSSHVPTTSRSAPVMTKLCRPLSLGAQKFCPRRRTREYEDRDGFKDSLLSLTVSISTSVNESVGAMAGNSEWAVRIRHGIWVLHCRSGQRKCKYKISLRSAASILNSSAALSES